MWIPDSGEVDGILPVAVSLRAIGLISGAASERIANALGISALALGGKDCPVTCAEGGIDICASGGSELRPKPGGYADAPASDG